MRSSFDKILLRKRRLFGVTSSSSSSLMNSIHCSRLIEEGVISRSASSLPEARVLVICFFLLSLKPIDLKLFLFAPHSLDSLFYRIFENLSQSVSYFDIFSLFFYLIYDLFLSFYWRKRNFNLFYVWIIY